ncbi:MAG: hypothetical protein ACRD0W_12385, partial [Acidimicrobiales bacterium]
SDVARRFGRRLGEELKARLGTRASRERRVTALGESLDRYGYEPRRENGAVRLSNCPFHALSETHRDLVCGMNLELLSGVIDGADGADVLEARLAPQPRYCCVRMKAS